jgi:signal transduction histidine kinase
LAVSLALVAIAAVCQRLYLNLATVSLLFVIIIALESRTGSLASSLLASVIATLGLAYIAPPAYSFRVDDPFDYLAIATFFVISIVISRLVSKLRRMTEEAMSTVDRKLIEAEERERAWIARELHDDFNQRIALVSVNLEHLQQALSDSEAVARKHVLQVQEQISDLATDIQALSHHLHSSKLEYLGLAAAANGLCRELSQEHGLNIDIHCDAVPKGLPQHVAVTLFRVLQEALQNVLKHSGSAQVNVALTGTSVGIELSVHDSGIGFDPKLAMKGTGLGLVSMQERLKLIRGEFAIRSQSDGGTTVQARVPLSDQSGAPN